MRPVITTFLTFLLFLGYNQAQIETPAPSPTAEIKQDVGLTEVSINYSRPGMKDRTIFAQDGLVPYGKMWRTGANAATTIEFSKDVVFGGKDVPAGKYALYTIPNPDKWTVMLYSDLSLGGNTTDYDDSKEVMRAEVDAVKMDWKLETFTIDIGDLRDNSATIGLIWEDVYVPVELKVLTDEQVMKQIDDFTSNPMGTVSGNYLNAGWYLHNSGKDSKKALEYMSKGLEHSTSPFKFFWITRKAEIQASTGDYKGAIATAQKAHEAGAMAEGGAKNFYEETVKGQLDDMIKECSMKQ